MATQRYFQAYCGGEVYEYRGHTFRVSIEQDDDMRAPWEEHDGHGPVSDWTSRDKKPGEWLLSKDRHSKRFYDAQEANEMAKRDGWGLTEEHKTDLIERLSRSKVIRRPKAGEKPVYDSGNGLYKYRADQIETVTIPGRDPAKPLTAGEIRAEAVRRDFDYLRGWANDQWHWQWIKVEMLDEEGESTDIEDSLGGVEDSDDEYLFDTVEELMDNCIRQKQRDLQEKADSEISESIDAAIESHEAAYWAARGIQTYPIILDEFFV